MLVLVDYDNTPAIYRTQPTRLFTHLIGVLGGIGTPFQNLHFRLYGGWDTFGGVATPLAQTISAQIQGALPYSIPPPIPGGTPTRVTAELVRSSLWIQIPLVDTFRARHRGQRGIRGIVPVGCANTPATPCVLHTALAVLGNAHCSATCPVPPHDAVMKDEQKQVDTCIVADLIYEAMMGSDPIGLVSSDDDLWPGIFASSVLGLPVVHVHTRAPSSCSLTYEGAVLARGPGYQRTTL
jgi:hypothetical protein